ncbi:sugar ABC transporter substrate-binding protein [Hoeflea sp. TYP-13]|uniref:sugar ABC transporter substrate-binding protein n=1 Tax=Hoeflea sp. TYP-13 TaxID=3230023 RepID=UPI0034C5B70E
MINKFTMTAIAAGLAVGGLFSSAAQAEDLKIAFFAASSQNGFNQAIYAGIEEKAKELGGVTTEIYDGQFNAAHQYSQIEDVLASGKFDGFVLAANDTVGIAGAVEQVAAAGKPIVTTLFPIGPDLTTLKRQVDGLTSTVASPPADGAKEQAKTVVEVCKDRNPCNVVIIVGQLIFPFDNLRYESFREVLDVHDNIKVVATGEGSYSPDVSLTAMTDILQANSDIHVVLSNADQHLVGVEIALEAAGYNVPDVFLSGGGAANIAINAIREGRWDATLAYFPKTMGAMALDIVVKELKGEDVPEFINMDEVGPMPPIIDKAILDANPDFVGEWEQ